MTPSNSNLHVYSREIKSDERTSLSVLASFVAPGSTVLDLGTGSGALGKFLHEQLQCTVDGLTFNAAEAEVAGASYRRIEVANLETCTLQDIFTGQRYDFIVCADVLEHLSRPERIVDACRDLLAPGGKLLISVPNAAYSGLIGELLQGDFLYREEGLLDRTHLRFFTRRSLTRFLAEQNWALSALDTVTRELPASEFRVAFDSLPPAMSRYLLAIPDALTYQFIAVAQPQVMDNTAQPDIAAANGGQALFSAQLYLGVQGEYAENTKLVTAGVIGQARQTLRFTLPAADLTRLRLDPADRPGFIHLYQFTLRNPQGESVWQWDSETDGIQRLETAPHHQIFLRPLWPASPAALVLLHGDDPWLELPIPQDVVAACTHTAGATLEAEVGWPMSADYLALAETVNPLTSRLSDLEHSTELERRSHEQAVTKMLASAGHNKILFEQNLEKTTSVLAALAEHNRLLLDKKLDLTGERIAATEQALAQTGSRLDVKLDQTTAGLIAATEHNKQVLEAKLDQTTTGLIAATERTMAQTASGLADHAELNKQALEAKLDQTTAGLMAATERTLAQTASGLSDRAEHNKQALEAKLDQTTAGLMALTAQNRMLFEQNRVLFEQELARKASELQALAEQHQVLMGQKNALLDEHKTLSHQKQNLQNDFNRLEEHLRWIENSTIFRATRPLVKFKMWLTGTTPVTPAAQPEPPPPATPLPVAPVHFASIATTDSPSVDIIVPVYKGLADTRCCIESVLAFAPSYQTPFRLIAINDASPDPEITAWLRNKAAQDSRLILLENPENLGFVGTVNRGMALSSTHDVILLNSDAEVANDWLDRMVRAAWSDPCVASVTPFSNNATICSYPNFCEDNSLPDGYDTARLDALFARTNSGQAVDVPTGVGFCMYIRRDALAAVGLFDVESFGKGYGEENDFCQRAAKAGWRNLHLLDTFVRHAGGVSFEASKNPRVEEAMNTLRRLHPDYEIEVHKFIGVDPARSARQMVDLARIRESGVPVVLAVMHDRAGGTARHVTELAGHLHTHAVFFSLTPSAGGRVVLQQLGQPKPWELSFHIDSEFDQLVLALRHIGVRHIHFHHLIGHGPRVLHLPEQLGVQYDFTTHDFYTLCPQISLTDSTNSYCGERGVEQCRSCLRISPAPGGMDIEAWRAHYGDFVAQARYVLAPSRDVAQRFARFAPTANIRYAPHTDMPSAASLPAPTPRRLGDGAPLKIVVVGALSPIKGADVLEDVAAEAARNGAPLEFHLVGFAYRDLRTQPSEYLKVHGQYAEQDLPTLFAAIQPDLAWFPAQWPETYSYTLSACLQAGLPIVAPDLGAFPERLNGRAWSWVRPWNTQAAAWLGFFLDIRQNHFMTGVPPAVVRHSDSIDAATQGWSYEQDYLAGLPVATPYTTPPSMSALVARQNERSADMQPWSQRTKQQVLTGLVHMRSARGMRRLARAIPLRWQTRVKSWLQG